MHRHRRQAPRGGKAHPGPPTAAEVQERRRSPPHPEAPNRLEGDHAVRADPGAGRIHAPGPEDDESSSAFAEVYLERQPAGSEASSLQTSSMPLNGVLEIQRSSKTSMPDSKIQTFHFGRFGSKTYYYIVIPDLEAGDDVCTRGPRDASR